MQIHLRVFIFTVFLVPQFFGCSTKTANLDTDTGTLEEGKRLLEEEYYEEARKQFFRIKTEFPKSALLADADLNIARSYFQEESYTAAASAFEEFIRTYPGRSEIPDALYELAQCHAEQIPSTHQRDNRPSEKAIEVLTRLLTEYPKHPQAEAAEKLMHEARQLQVEKVFGIARFYERQGHHLAAARRYEQVVDRFSDHPLAEEAFARRIRELRRGQQNEKADQAFEQFKSKFPQSSFESLAKEN